MSSRATVHQISTAARQSTTAAPSMGEQVVLRWGGLAGILGGVLFILVFVIVGLFVGADPAGPEGTITRFPDIRAGRTVENGLYLLVLLLWVAHLVALYRTLRGSSLAPALIGCVVGVLGLGVLAAGAVPHAASVPISDLYHAPGATPADQATLVLVWQATQGIFNALLVTGLVILPFSLVALGVAMLGARQFGKAYGWVSVALGVVGIGAAIALLIDPLSFIAVVVIFALIAFHLVVGWKVFRLSTARPETA
jgi:hypothetical protein